MLVKNPIIDTMQQCWETRQGALVRLGELSVYGETSAFERTLLLEIVKQCDSTLAFYHTVNKEVKV